MLGEISVQIRLIKTKDIRSRLEKKYSEQVLPAEMELSLLWALGKLGRFEAEPDWWPGPNRPDAVTDVFVANRVTAIEIAALSDNAISGEKDMDRFALRVSEYASSIRKRAGDYLYFVFAEESGYSGGIYRRRRLVPPAYEISDSSKAKVRKWLTSGEAEKNSLRITEPNLCVEIQKKQYKRFRYSNFHCSMPPETHSLTENPLYKLLTGKKSQLSAAPPHILKVLFLADVGSTLLRRNCSSCSGCGVVIGRGSAAVGGA